MDWRQSRWNKQSTAKKVKKKKKDDERSASGVSLVPAAKSDAGTQQLNFFASHHPRFDLLKPPPSISQQELLSPSSV
ncbi:unnamed protein product [Linum trigynum]|uniref:Uncharacterized protein n=1 Tax=Linum trigynum TaxID=586398 RepID=A0AAV2ERL4_9ROSI